ncbi:MAG: hypothetical protein K6E91_04300 [Butyrivibrio sp.]|nr:hypothetical protein [Butyrivibrio sp.]
MGNLWEEMKNEWLSEGEARGVAIGEPQGEEKMLIRQVCRKMQKGKTVDEIAYDLDEEADSIMEIYEAAQSCAPDYDVNAIYEKLKMARV